MILQFFCLYAVMWVFIGFQLWNQLFSISDRVQTYSLHLSPPKEQPMSDYTITNVDGSEIHLRVCWAYLKNSQCNQHLHVFNLITFFFFFCQKVNFQTVVGQCLRVSMVTVTAPVIQGPFCRKMIQFASSYYLSTFELPLASKYIRIFI